MKKHLKILALAVVAVFLVAGSALAYPFIEVSGWVDPYGATITDVGDGNSTVTGLEYTFYVDTADSGAEMDYLSLEFENDVFTNVSNLQFVLPTDWTSTLITSSSGNRYEITSAGTTGTTLGVGEYMQFTADVTMYNTALTDPSFWDEGQVWAQSWTAGDTLRGSHGGSTAPAPVPEPATVLLMGAGLGLFGLGALCRKKLGKA